MTQQTFGEARDFVNFTFEGNASVSNILSGSLYSYISVNRKSCIKLSMFLMIRFALPCICYKIIFIIHIVILIVLYYQHIRLNWMEQNGIKYHPCSTVSKKAA